MQLAGYSNAASFKLGIVQQAISMIGNLTSVSLERGAILRGGVFEC
jgi:hypothetical protein